ncbi:MAG: hypothetical protein HY671_06210 [Chloroflexi bacterium]|nr:hypothetical protein [Chloroflexota bacterium]
MLLKSCLARSLALLAVGVLVTLMVFPALATAQPARGIRLLPEFTSIVIGREDDARLTVRVANTGKDGEFVDLEIVSPPSGWEARFSDFSFGLRGVYVAAGKEQEVTFRAKPPADAAVSDYTFDLKAITRDKQVQDTLRITIGIQAQGATAEKVQMVTLYPEVSTPAGASIQFNIDLTNQGRTDRTFELVVKGAPQQWTTSVEPAFEKKQISTISLKAGETKGVNLILTPNERQAPGDFPVSFTARSGSVQETLNLKVGVTGSYDILVTTPTGRLNADAVAGQESVMALVVANIGTAEVKGISFSSTKPDGWDIKFEPEKIDTLAAAEIREVSVKIKAPDKTIAGDYAISLNALGQRSSSTKDIRVTVSTPTKWGAVGIGIVVVVVAGLAGIFVRLGRR